MSLFGGLGKITGFIADVVMDGVKESTGVDLKEMKRNYSSANERLKSYQKELNELKANREQYIAEYGREEYDQRIKELTEGIKECAGMVKSNLESVAADIESKKSEYSADRK